MVIKRTFYIFLLFERRYESFIEIIPRTMSFIMEKINCFNLRHSEDIVEEEERPLKKNNSGKDSKLGDAKNIKNYYNINYK